MANASVLFSGQNRIFLELPIGKNGDHSVQKGQKGQNCIFYAMKRLLATAQIHSEHGRTCSLRRKMITAADDDFSSLEEYHKARAKANEAFLRAKGEDPKKAAHKFWLDTMKQSMAEVPREYLDSPKFEKAMDQALIRLDQVKPWHRLEQMENAANHLMFKGHGLQEVPYKDLATARELIQTLQTKGPLLITGRFGRHFYADQEPIKVAQKIGTHTLHGWKKGSPTSESIGVGHAIVLIGAQIDGNKEYVYWIDPVDPSDPENPSSQKVYMSTFMNVAARMYTLAGLPMGQMTLESKEIIAGALFNPAFKGSKEEPLQVRKADDEEKVSFDIGTTLSVPLGFYQFLGNKNLRQSFNDLSSEGQKFAVQSYQNNTYTSYSNRSFAEAQLKTLFGAKSNTNSVFQELKQKVLDALNENKRYFPSLAEIDNQSLVNQSAQDVNNTLLLHMHNNMKRIKLNQNDERIWKEILPDFLQLTCKKG